MVIEFQDLISNNIVLVSTDNTTVVAYINKEWGMRLGSLCALLWRILSWCTRKQITLKACHIPGRLNVIADKLSKLGQIIQREWSLHPDMFQAICSCGTSPRWTCLPPGSTTNCQSLCHWFQTPKHEQWMHSVCPGKIWTLIPSHQQPSWAKWWRSCRTNPCNKIILIALGWPNMPWFWDLVAMSSQIPLCLPSLPNLVTQPFNQTLHRNLSNLNLHAWLLEPQQSRSRASLRQWQHELRLLKEDQPDPSMRQSGPFLQSGASVICTQAPLMATDQPLLTSWATLPSMSAKMRISLVSWIVSIETDPRAGGAYPSDTSPWFYTS